MKVVIIGGSHAGVSAALRLKDLDESLEILLIEQSNELGFLASSINLFMQDQIKSLEDGQFFTINELFERGIHVLLNTSVEQILPESKKVICQMTYDKRKQQSFTYDSLILATGSSHIEIGSTWTQRGVLANYKTYDGSQLALEQIQHAKTVVIIGAGLIGFELADSLIKKGKNVHLVDRMNELLFRYVDKEFSASIKRKLPENLQLHLGVQVIDTTNIGEDKVSIRLSDGTKISCDNYVFSVNPRPSTNLTKDLLAINPDGTVVTNEFLQTSDDAIYAVGDLIGVPFKNTHESNYVPLLSNAVRTGIIAANNIISPRSTPIHSVQRTIVSTFFGMNLASCGLTEEEAPYFGIACGSTTKVFTEKDKRVKLRSDMSHYSECKLVYEVDTLKVIGGQLLTSSKEMINMINILSVLIAKEVTVTELAVMDFYFQPVFSQPLHPLNELALSILKEINHK